MEYDKALEINDEYIYALLGKAKSLLSINNKHEAGQLVNKALEIEPSNPLALKAKDELDK